MHVIITALACLLGTILWQRDAVALDYPTHPVRVIIPFTPGGAPDVLLRIVAQQLQEKWHQGVVVENRAGGNTLVGTVAAAKRIPDGYTLLLAADQTFVLNPLLYTSLPYSMKEFDSVAMLASIPHMLAVANKVPAANVLELIALAKEKPDTLMYGTTGPARFSASPPNFSPALPGLSSYTCLTKGR